MRRAHPPEYEMLDHILCHLHEQRAEFLSKLMQIRKLIMVTSVQHAQDLRDLKTQNEKARAENLAKLEALQDAIDSGGNTTPEIDAAMADLKASIQSEDDETPDPVTP